MGLYILLVNFGHLEAKVIPIINGMPSSIKTVLNISTGSILIGLKSSEASIAEYTFIYRPPHREKFKGVNIIAPKVANAVKVTDNAALAFASDDIKFDIFPPGQDATSIIPNAMLGVM